MNAGYDSLPMATGKADTGVNVWNKQSVFLQQVAAGLEAVSDTCNFNIYGLFPIGDTEQRLNSHYSGGAMHTYGFDVGYGLTSDLKASVRPYYQHGDDITANDRLGVQADLEYLIANGLTLGVNISYDQAFDTRVSGNISYRFGSNEYGAPSGKKEWRKPVIQSLSETVKHRNLRVHDAVHQISGENCNQGSNLSRWTQYRLQKGKTKHGERLDKSYHCGKFSSGGSVYYLWNTQYGIAR